MGKVIRNFGPPVSFPDGGGDGCPISDRNWLDFARLLDGLPRDAAHRLDKQVARRVRRRTGEDD